MYLFLCLLGGLGCLCVCREDILPLCAPPSYTAKLDGMPMHLSKVMLVLKRAHDIMK